MRRVCGGGKEGGDDACLPEATDGWGGGGRHDEAVETDPDGGGELVD